MAAQHRGLSVSRRRFVQSAGVAGLGLLGGGCAVVTLPTMPPRRPAVVALLMVDAPPASNLDLFRAGLAEHGWALGHNLVLAERSGEGHYERLPELAQELLAVPSDVLVTVSTPATIAARKATGTVPIVFVTGSDPVPYGLADSHQRPGGNVTGFTVLSAELAAKRLELLTELAPSVVRIAVLWREPAALPEVQRAAQARKVEVYPVEVVSPDALWRGLNAAVAWGADALQIELQPAVGPANAELAAFAAAHRLPAISGHTAFSAVGGLAMYSPRVQESFRRAAVYVDRILRGASPATLPIEQPREFDFVINLKTAQALGLAIPPHVLLQATEVSQ
jgi:putative ABC transport system substrate-binding protein